MTTEQITLSAFESIWSALHYPNDTNHSGYKILELFKNNAMSPYQKGLLHELETTKNFSAASLVVSEFQNLLIGNTYLTNQIQQALVAGQNDVKIPMPPIQIQPDPEPEYEQYTSSDNGGSVLWDIIKFIIAIVGFVLNIAQCAN